MMRNPGEVQAELERVEALVWYARYYPHRRFSTYPASAHLAARDVEDKYGDAIAKVDFDQPWQVARLEGQQAALRWLTAEPGDMFDELAMHGPLYDS